MPLKKHNFKFKSRKIMNSSPFLVWEEVSVKSLADTSEEIRRTIAKSPRMRINAFFISISFKLDKLYQLENVLINDDKFSKEIMCYI